MTASEVQDSPTAWFVLLERARRSGDADLERKAMSELHRLGVQVKWPADNKNVDGGKS